MALSKHKQVRDRDRARPERSKGEVRSNHGSGASAVQGHPEPRGGECDQRPREPKQDPSLAVQGVEVLQLLRSLEPRLVEQDIQRTDRAFIHRPTVARGYDITNHSSRERPQTWVRSGD